MLNYMYTPAEFSFTDSVEPVINHSTRSDREWYCRMSTMRNLPQFVRFLNYISMYHGVGIYIASTEPITRSTTLPYQFTRYKEQSEPENNYWKPLYFSKEQLTEFGIEDVCAIHFVPVTGQITETFETQIPAWAQEINASELLNVSLALKLSPKHRVRVYKRDEHIFVFTTRGLNDYYENDYMFYRKLFAAIPYIRDWQESKPELTELYKLLAKDDATDFWSMLEQFYTNTPAIKDIKYKTIIDTFKNISRVQLNTLINARNLQQQNAEDLLIRYANTLKEQQKFERKILEFNTQDTEFSEDLIKLLYDKKIAYAVDIRLLNDTSHPKLSYRCSTPCTNFDKEAALVYYNSRIKDACPETVCNIFKLIFIQEKVLLNFDEEIVLSFRDFTINAREGNLLHGNDCNTVFPNPHHTNFNCWGSYAPIITKLISQFKLEDLFYQIKAAVGSLNFVDYTVMSRFISHLSNIADGTYDPRCFLWRDENCTTLHTINETLEKFKEELTV